MTVLATFLTLLMLNNDYPWLSGYDIWLLSMSSRVQDSAGSLISRLTWSLYTYAALQATITFYVFDNLGVLTNVYSATEFTEPSRRYGWNNFLRYSPCSKVSTITYIVLYQNGDILAKQYVYGP